MRSLSLLFIAVAILSTPAFADPQKGVATETTPLKFKVKWLAIDTNEACDVGDINKDGQMDVIAGRNWYAAPDYLPRPVRGIGEFGKDYSENNGEHLYDVDGDGWLDLVAGSFVPTKLNWYKNPGKQGLEFGKIWPEKLLADTGFSQNEMSWFRDMDGDGKPEFVTNSWNKEMRLAWWNIETTGKKKSLAAKATGVVIGTENGHGQGFGDLNGDGLEDIVFGNGWYERPKADADKGNWPVHSDFQLPHASCPILVLDVDNDGRNDLVWGNGHGYGLHYYRQLEPVDGKLAWEKNELDKTWSQAHALTWADIDGDGEKEIITGKRVRAHSGGDPGAGDESAMYYYDLDKTTKKFTRHLIAKGVGSGLQIRVADMNGDKLMDVVVAGKDGTQILFQVK